MKVLFIGDINGSIGRKAVAKILPKLKKDLKYDLVIANADNIAHGSGVTEKTIKELMDTGVNYFTNGDHAFDKTSSLDCYDTQPIIRPANFPEGVPGQGFKIIELGKYKILLINLIGRVFMDKDYDCPFRKVDEILAMFAKKKLSAIIIDMHAEATSENVSLGHYLDGQVSAIFGTHTHIMTADNKVTEKGMAYITDVGMVGADNECIGVAKEGIIKTFLTQIKNSHVIPEKGKAIFNAVLVNINPKNKKAINIKPIIKFINIK